MISASGAARALTAGKHVFEEFDVPSFRSTDPKLIATVRSVEEFTKVGGHDQKDGRVHSLRWVPTVTSTNRLNSTKTFMATATIVF